MAFLRRVSAITTTATTRAAITIRRKYPSYPENPRNPMVGLVLPDEVELVKVMDWEAAVPITFTDPDAGFAVYPATAPMV